MTSRHRLKRRLSVVLGILFYLHVQGRTAKDGTKPTVDFIPIADYLFRWNRGGFWMGKYAFKYFPFVPFNKLHSMVSRWFLDDFMHTRMLYRALQKINNSFEYIVQDLSLPYSTAGAFIDYNAAELDVWPIWLCPLRQISGPTFHPSTLGPGGKAAPMLNVGIWGSGSKVKSEFLQQNQRLESKLTELGGRKVLYSHTYYSETEFWGLYNKKWYDDLRQRYMATTLPTVYDKVKMDMVKFSSTN